MNGQAILDWIRSTAVGETVRHVPWLFSTLETVHFIGLCLLMGALLVVDLRLIGFFRPMPIQSALKYTHFAVAGFTLNLLSGIGFFASDPQTYWDNPAFRLKMGLIVVAGLNLLYFETVERKKMLELAPDANTMPDTKVVASLSLLLWTAILILGRLLPQFGQSH